MGVQNLPYFTPKATSGRPVLSDGSFMSGSDRFTSCSSQRCQSFSVENADALDRLILAHHHNLEQFVDILTLRRVI